MKYYAELMMASNTGRINPDTADSISKFLSELYPYLVAASDGTMTRNNSENLAAELLEILDSK